jgi:hypothetical protein
MLSHEKSNIHMSLGIKIQEIPTQMTGGQTSPNKSHTAWHLAVKSTFSKTYIYDNCPERVAHKATEDYPALL